MGLMLSVLVFCVGVAEILDCWHHFLLHLVQPQYNPLPSHLNLKSDYLSDKEILNPLSESRRTSNVDICWPKDLSPDDIHVIKKRPHGEGDPDPPPRVVRKLLHEKDTSPFPTSKNVEVLTPDIVVHTPEPSLISPTNSRESSPNRLELGVIVESDSSSEVDEPSQIENLNYKKGKDYDCIEQEEELSDLCHGGTLPVSEESRPRCPSAKILEEEWENESVQKGSDIEKTCDSETSSLPDLPVFTDDILSRDVMKVNVHYPTNSGALNLVEPSSDVTDQGDSKIGIRKELKSSKPEPFELNTGPNYNTTVQPISSLLDEGLEPIPEFPEIKVQESSPVPQADDSDSSLNTSDASWMVRSKTSDRPLVIRLDTSPEKVQQDFQSVIQTDLRALGDKELIDDKGSPSGPFEKADSVDVYYDALIDQNGEDRQVKYQNDISLEENPNRVEKFYNGVDSFEADVKPSSVNFMQIDSNSSSSSLSGVPPLPEDTLESLTQTSLPTDNSFSQTNDMLSIGISYSQSDNPDTSFSTSETGGDNNRESCIPVQQRSDQIESVKIELTPDAQSVKGINISESENISPGTGKSKSHEGISSTNDFKKEIENISVSPNNQNEKRIPEHTDSSDGVANDGKAVALALEGSVTGLKHVDGSPSDGVANDGNAVALALEGSVTGLKHVDGSPSTKTDSGMNHLVSFCQENIASDSNLQIISNNSSTINKTDTESEDRKTSNPSDGLMPKDFLVNDNKKDESNVTLESTRSNSSSEVVPNPSNKDNDKPNIPTDSQETRKPIETQKGALPKVNSSKKPKTKPSSKNSSSDSSDTVVLCRAKQSDDEMREESRASALSSAPVKTDFPIDSVSKTELPVKAGPSKPTEEVKPSTSKGEEDKAFWLIFSGEYTKAMSKDWHSGHFCCWQCDESLTGQRYVLRDEHPYCVKCYESVFANGCEECSKTIGIDSKDLSYKDKHWHEACFLCNKCRVSLVDKQFGSKLEKIFCGNCYDQQFASRCDGCGQIFKAGTKKMEYKTRQWHEPCFSCCVCKSAIGTKSFIPREQEIYCATCYEEKFATRCVKCNKIITSGGVTYKNEPWHRECFTCTNCNTSLAGQRFTSRDEKPYCAECFGELFAKRCTACSKPITGIGGTRFISFEDRHWHNDCFICASCKTSLVGRGFITDADDIICPECAKQKLM